MRNRGFVVGVFLTICLFGAAFVRLAALKRMYDERSVAERIAQSAARSIEHQLDAALAGANAVASEISARNGKEGFRSNAAHATGSPDLWLIANGRVID